MKLNIEELAREAELSAVAATPQPVKVGDGDKFLKLRDEFFTRLIVERCAEICEEEAAGHRSAFGEHCAIMIRRKLLEAE